MRIFTVPVVVILIGLLGLFSCRDGIKRPSEQQLVFSLKISLKGFGKTRITASNAYAAIKVVPSDIRLETDEQTVIVKGDLLKPGLLNVDIYNLSDRTNWPIVIYVDGKADSTYINADIRNAKTPGLPAYPAVVSSSPLQKQLSSYMYLRDSTRKLFYDRRTKVREELVRAIENDDRKLIDSLSDIVNNFEHRFRFYEIDAAKRFLSDTPFSLISVYAALEAKIARWDPQTGFSVYRQLPADLRSSEYGELLNKELLRYRSAAEKTGNKVARLYGKDDNGKEIDAPTAFRHSKYTLVVFWASWCGSCIREVPELNQLYDKYRGKGFNLIAVSIDENRDNWLKAIKTNKFKASHLLELKGTENIKQFNITTVPYSFLLNSDGTILNVNSPLDSIRMKLMDL